MKDVKETLNGLMKETYNHYNSTIDYVAKHLKKHGEGFASCLGQL